MENKNLEHIITMLEHYEYQALNLEIGIKQIRNYVEMFLKNEEDEENE